jgi:hypothetical protein
METSLLEHRAPLSDEKSVGCSPTRTQIGIFDVNFDTGDRYWSDDLRDILGIPRHLPPEFRLLLRRVHPEDRRAVGEITMEPFRPDCAPYRSSEFRLVQENGTVERVRAARVCIFRPEGAHDVVRVLGTIARIQ